MALVGTDISIGFNFVFIFISFISFVSTSRYCNIEYECYKICNRSIFHLTDCGWWICPSYATRTYTCKSVCHREDCCNGYTGVNCSTPTSCDDAQSLPDLERRARNYQAKGDIGNDPYINDEYLGPGWFSVGNYRMPDSNTVPNNSYCGTIQPVYIQGTHPDVSTFTDDSPVSLVACELYPFHVCLNTINIEVRQCDNDTQYYLTRTSAQSGYCIDPPNIANVAVFEAAPTDVTIGDLTVDPKLKFRENRGYEIPYLHFECTENPKADRSADQNFYSTYWFVESTLLKAYERQSNFKTIDETDLMDSGYQLGVTIQCGIRVSTSITGFQTEMKSSASFFAGVEIEPLVINMNKGDTASITLRPTVPFGCYAAVGATPTGRCFHTVNMHYPDLSNTQCEIDITSFGSVPMVNSLQEQCGVEIEGFYPYQAVTRTSSTLVMDSVSMNLTSPYFSDSDPTEYKLSLKTKNGGTHEIWKNVYLSQVQLNIITQNKYKKKMCYAHVDPHMKTSDGRPYENNDYAGSFIMYEHDTGIQVQMKTVACNNNRAYCACAVAVRAGGDVFLINLCGGLRFKDMTSCKDGGTLVVQKYSELSYQVQTNIGTLVKINILSGNYKNLMNIDIYMAPKDYNRIKGLCGTFDGYTNNDFHDRSGTKVDRTSFLQAWKLSNSDINLLEPSCSVDVGTWTESGQPLYCTCNCFNEGQCGTLEETATCSPSQYVNCTVSLTITSDLCQDYEKRCSIQSTRK
ncbi:von Willebrand factor D and EGF domain-containing protein-like, partial [Mercenaria mercenaria]|uniref:von Willebrand factor D and EGF domain-containing protein-like n=1 Tax=Mercenaria mercenaria TaxID=6596 RepID=UPI00234E81AC